MKAAVYEKYGPPEVIHLAEVQKPIHKDNELLVKVISSAVNSADSRVRSSNFPPGFGFFARLIFGITSPNNKILGTTFAGIVEAVGKDVKDFKVGDDVFGLTGMKMSSHAEYLTVAEDKAIILKPKNLSFNEAAALPFGATTALYFLRDLAKITQDQKILINGASGAVGTNAIQIAKFYGANVTALCSGANHDLVKSLGADKIIDYQKTNFLLADEKYDLILDTVGNLPISETKNKLTSNGKLLLVVAGLKDMILPKKNVLQGTSPERKEDLVFLVKLFEEGKLKVVIDKVYSLNEIVEASRHVDSGHKKGNVVISIA